jgi:tetratricopeptide (TPR) repeat protein
VRIALVIAALALAGCPNKNKKNAARPENKSDKTANPADIDPEGGLPNPGDPGDSTVGPDGKPAITPPGLDLSPTEKKRRVTKAVGAGNAALTGRNPDSDEAVRQAKIALSVDEMSVDAMIVLAHANIVKRYYDQATDVLEKALERGGAKRREIHFLFGLVYDRTEQHDKAFAAYRRAVALSPGYTSALMNLGVHYLRNQRYADATQIFERLTGELDYRSAAAWTNLGSAYRGRSAEFTIGSETARNQMIQRAEKTYKQAISRDKTYANAYYNLGLLYLDSDPFPTTGGKELDNLRRLRRAKSYFDEYRRLPGADVKRVDDVAATAQKLIEREERLRKKREERERRKREREKRRGKG